MRRRALIGASGDLPSGYTRLKYLESTGHQHLFFPIYDVCPIFRGRGTVRIDGQISGNWGTAVGFQPFQVGKWFGNGYINAMSWSMSLSAASVPMYGGTTYKLEFAYNYGDVMVRLDDSTATANITDLHPPGDSGVGLFLFRVDANYYPMIGRLGDLILYNTLDDSGVMADLICALNDSGKPGMYDTVSKTFKTNAGTGEFGYETMDGTYVSPI